MAFTETRRVFRQSRLTRVLRQQDSLRAVIESISSELELRPLLTRIVTHACELLEADHGTIGLVDEERQIVRTEAAYNMPPDEIGSEMGPGVGIAGQVLVTGQPVIVQRYGALPNPTQHEMLDNAVLGMPILWRGSMIGFFGIGKDAMVITKGGRRRARPFRKQDVETLGVFARHAAIAINNARVFALSQERAERLALVTRVTRVIAADLRLDEILQRAADTVHELLGFPNVAIPVVERASRSGEPDALVLNAVGGHYRQIVRGEHRIPVTQGIMGAAARLRETQLVNGVESDPRWIAPPGAVGIFAELAVPIVLGDEVLGVLNVESEQPLSDSDAEHLTIVADQLAVAIENARLHAASRDLAALEERHRIARELHDSVTQLLFSANLVAQTLDAAFRENPAEGERRASRLQDLTHTALGEMRALLAELKPAATQPARRGELAAALARFAAAQGATSGSGRRLDDGPRIAIDIPDDLALTRPGAEALYRIAREAIHNAVKHARARSVTVRATRSPAEGGVRLLVTDDGVGFEASVTQTAGTTDSMGLVSMRERAESLGGRLAVTSASGAGTRVDAFLPGVEAT